MAPFLVCPLCAGPFDAQDGAWRCIAGHAFDVAREGYVNLLPAHHKHSKDPGDRPESLQARRAFLDTGHYAPLRDAMVERLAALRPDHLLDIGCGEGYYTAAMAAQSAVTAGLDIAKPAIRLAAKRFGSGITWVVGSGARLPVADDAIDVILATNQLEKKVLNATSVLIYASGGQSQLETWDPKPDAPAEVRGEFGTIATSVPGLRFPCPG